MKLDQIGHFIVCVSYKWYQCHSNDFNLFLRLALGDLSLSVFTFSPSVYSHSFKKHTVQGYITYMEKYQENGFPNEIGGCLRWSLLDADQEIPWQDQPLEYSLKFRFWAPGTYLLSCRLLMNRIPQMGLDVRRSLALFKSSRISYVSKASQKGHNQLPSHWLDCVKVLVEHGDFMPETLRFKLYHLIQCRMYYYLSQIHLKKIPSSTRPLSHREKKAIPPMASPEVEEYDETYHTMLRAELWTELSRRIWGIYLHGIYQSNNKGIWKLEKRESFSNYW